jgi:stress-induced morphogen
MQGRGMMEPGDLERLVAAALPGSAVAVTDMTGTRDHYEVRVVSAAFDGKTLIERHRIMHRIFEPYLNGPVHAVKYKTLTPAESAR